MPPVNRCFVDTNVILRFLTNDKPAQARQARDLFARAQQGEVVLVLNTMVIAEVVWTLQSFYHYPKKQIDEIVSAIVASRVFEIDERDILLQALENFHFLNIDFIDAYIGAWMQERAIEGICTLNEKHFRRLPGVKVVALQSE